MEDYKKKYEQALERCKKEFNFNNLAYSHEEIKQRLERVFPELKESEDERIRKSIIDLVEKQMPKSENKKWMISWLERQKEVVEEYEDKLDRCACESFDKGYKAATEKIDAIENFDTEFEKQVSYLIASAINKEHEYNEGFVKWTANALLNYAKHELEKQGEQPNKVSIWKHWKDGIAGNGEGKLTYLIKIGNTYNLTSCLGFECDYIELSELDKLCVKKQGEQSKQHLYDIIIALWDLLDKIDTFSDLQIDDTSPDNPFRKIEDITQERHKFVKSDGYNLYIKGEQITDFKQSKQKPTDKVEPKFKKE